MSEREVFVWMIALGEARGATWDYENMGFDLEEAPDAGDAEDV